MCLFELSSNPVYICVHLQHFVSLVSFPTMALFPVCLAPREATRPSIDRNLVRSVLKIHGLHKSDSNLPRLVKVDTLAYLCKYFLNMSFTMCSLQNLI